MRAEREAQGRLPKIKPVSVIDIGSNSVRLVVYEGTTRSPTVLFNEKVLCALGRGLADTGKLDEEGVTRALATLERFTLLSAQAGAKVMHPLATAAAREAENGPQFIADAEAVLGKKIKVLSGHEEALYSALGIVSGFVDPDGVVGDLGGGSLELVGLHDGKIGEGVTLPLGGLRLQDVVGDDMSKAAKTARNHLKNSELKAGKGQNFYAVGGTWRNLAKLHMERTKYPLHVTHGYEIPYDKAQDFLAEIIKSDPDDVKGIEVVSKRRRSLLSIGAVVLSETLKYLEPDKLVFSSTGIREGYLYSLLPDALKARDPLLSSAEEMAILRSRSPEHARELAEWTKGGFEAFGVDETEEEARYRQAACLLADISWRAHPDYRGSQALNIISHAGFLGISHSGRAYVALVNYYRHEGVFSDPDSGIADIATSRMLERARLLGALMRVGYLLSASMPGVLSRVTWKAGKDKVVLRLPAEMAPLEGERPLSRMGHLEKLTGKALVLETEA